MVNDRDGGAGGHDGRVRVGYLSFNFSPSRNLNGLVAGLLQRHDRARFHTWAFAIYGHHGRDTEAERRQAEDSADVFVDLLRHVARSDTDISRAINERKIHVLVDLFPVIALSVQQMGGMTPSVHLAPERPPAAPVAVQVNMVGLAS